MIQPNVRASFGRAEAELLISIAGPSGEERLRSDGIDALLDDVDLVRELLKRQQISIAPGSLTIYLLVRHALLERDLRDRQMADYTAALLLEFGRLRRNALLAEHMPDTLYLSDVLVELEQAEGDREFQLRAHLGNLALWLAGVFPDRITVRTQRKGAPPMSYYDQLGATGFRTAAGMSVASRYGVDDLFLRFSDHFAEIRSALNALSDTLFFPHPSDSVERVLREVSERFERQQRT